MLIELSLENFTLIESQTLRLSSGMTVITGETGAGKSIWVDALNLLLGARGDAHFVRHQTPYARLRAIFKIPGETQDILLERVIHADGKSKASIQNIPCSLQQLKQTGTKLMGIHGQHEHQALLNLERQASLLDQFGGHHPLLALLSQITEDLKAASTERTTVLEQQQKAQHALTLLDYQIQELEAVGLKDLDLQALDAELSRLTHAITLQTTTQHISEALLHAEEAVCAPLQRMLSELTPLLKHDPALQDPRDRLHAAVLELAELGHDMARYSERMAFDPARLAHLEAQFLRFSDLARKHHIDIQDLPQHLTHLLAERACFEDLGERLIQLDQTLSRQKQAYLTTATELSHQRAISAHALAQRIDALLPEIAIHQGRFEVRLTSKPLHLYSPLGLESGEFWMSTNPGQPLSPISQIVSGGELSRISLALQRVMDAQAPLPTRIFDEVDVGISGAIAEQIGRLLKRLSQHTQVLCITHLPQVAALADHHFQIQKHHHTHHAYSTVTEVTGQARVRALAELMGGLEITALTLSNAQAWLDQAGLS